MLDDCGSRWGSVRRPVSGPQRLAVFVGIAAAVSLVFGCRSAPEEEIAPWPRSVTVALPHGSTTLVPDEELELYAISALNNVYETLFDRNRAPLLAESWQNPDDLTWRIVLRSGVRFHDGELLGADDVAAQLRAVWMESSPEAIAGDAPLPIAAIETDGPREVVIRTTEPVSLIQPLARVHIWRRSEAGNPVGTGPFRVATFESGRRLDLERFYSYWSEPPHVDRLSMVVVHDAHERLEAFRAGSVDVVFDPEMAPDDEPETALDSTLVARPGARVMMLGMNGSVAMGDQPTAGGHPLSDPRVRRAIALAIDRERLAVEAMNGLAEPVDQLVSADVFGHHAGLEVLPHDPDAARRLLQEAGFGEGFEVTLDYPAEKYRSLPRVAEAIASDLGAVGIQLTPRPDDFGAFMERLARQGSRMFLLGWINGWDAGFSYRFLVHTPGDGLGGSNWFGYSVPEVDAALGEDLVTLEAGKRRGILDAVTERLQIDLPFIPLYRQHDLFAVRQGLVFEPEPGNRIPGATLAWSTE